VGACGHEGGARVDAVGAPARVLAEGARDGRELLAEIAPGERPTRLLQPADVVDAVEGDEVEQCGRRPGAQDEGAERDEERGPRD